ncbi:hypothetical protein EOM39_01195 [Candidatus Gracilibacteria bacterium]|nr:hypothetical protein [Candidatus Gracilibacteria bacterium]
MIINYESSEIRKRYLEFLKEKKISKLKLLISYVREITKFKRKEYDK